MKAIMRNTPTITMWAFQHKQLTDLKMIHFDWASWASLVHYAVYDFFISKRKTLVYFVACGALFAQESGE